MTAHRPVTRASNGFTADASKVSPARFLAEVERRFFPAPPKTQVSERADAATKFISSAWGKSREEIAELRATMNRELAEIDAKYRVARDLNAAVIL